MGVCVKFKLFPYFFSKYYKSKEKITSNSLSQLNRLGNFAFVEINHFSLEAFSVGLIFFTP